MRVIDAWAVTAFGPLTWISLCGMTSLSTTASVEPRVRASDCLACQLLPSTDQLWQPWLSCRIVTVAVFGPAASAEPATASAMRMANVSFTGSAPSVTGRAGVRRPASGDAQGLCDGDSFLPRVLRPALAEELGGVLASAERSADHENAEPESRQEQRDADDDAEQRDVLSEEARVQCGGERGLGDPDLADRVVGRLTALTRQRLGRVVGALAVRCREPRQLGVGDSTGRLERVDPHVGREVTSPLAGVDRLAGNVGRRQLDARREARLLRLRRDRGLVHVGRTDNLLQLQAVVDSAAPVDAHHDRGDAKPDQQGRCDDPADLE